MREITIIIIGNVHQLIASSVKIPGFVDVAILVLLHLVAEN